MEAARAYFSRKLRELFKNAPFQLLYFDQNTLYINSPHETTSEYLFLKIHKKYYEIIQYLILYLIFHKFVSIFLPQGGLRVRDTLYAYKKTCKVIIKPFKSYDKISILAYPPTPLGQKY